ncbi:MAG: efflux RND transporter permease subunit [Pseudomonadales bacterium]|nr:efflux RND transporter permease subunit [Pseudomonadales bacterium]
MEKGEPPLLAAYNGARQVAFAVIATTAVLVAVFTPIIFLEDNMGVIFRELAVTISAAVIFSSVLALTLTPVMCAKLLSRKHRGNAFTRQVDRNFTRFEALYQYLLQRFLRHSWLAVVATGLVLGATWWLAKNVPQEYAPQEDQGGFFARAQAAEGTSISRMLSLMERLEAPLMQLYAEGEVSRVVSRVPGFGDTATSTGILIVSMAPWDERTLTTQQAVDRVMADWQTIPSVRAFAFVRSGLSKGGGDRPVQFVIGGPNFETLAEWRDILIERAEGYPGLERIDSDLKETQPQVSVRVDKNRAAALGISVQNVGRTLAAMMSEQRVTTYVQDGEEYDVILQAAEDQRATERDLQNIYVRSESSGELIPLSNLIYMAETAGPASLNRYNRLRAVTLTANLAEGYALGDALKFLEDTVATELPEFAQIDYKGESLEYKEASGSLLFTFTIALLIVFLVLAAQFESFIHPFVILLSVPMAVAGALFGLYATGSTLNIYSQIGMVMLIGIAAKNGVLIVEFINQLRDAGRDFQEAILEAAGIRLRPVLMTTISTVIGSIPLIVASGAGSSGRNVLGIVIFAGVSLATLLTLFVVPAFYQLLAKNSGSPKAIARELEELGGTL